MTQENKELLIKDLCARVPYNVFVNCTEEDDERTNFNCLFTPEMVKDIQSETAYWIVKPYLRPMLSMTEEEKKEFNKLIGGENTNWYLFDENRIAHCKSLYSVFCRFSTMGKIIDFFNAHHLDFCGLIPMGLALEATKDMYKTE